MEHIYNDIDFMNMLEPILHNDIFLKSQQTIHHGLKKLDHSMKVAYYSYNIAKKYDLDYVSVARGGILHDFYYSNTNGKSICKDSIELTFSHNKTALNNANKTFKLNDLEKDIIVKHMFPIVFTIPKYKESLLVCSVDKVIGVGEFIMKAKSLVNFKVLSKVIPLYILFISTLK